MGNGPFIYVAKACGSYRPMKFAPANNFLRKPTIFQVPHSFQKQFCASADVRLISLWNLVNSSIDVNS